MSHAFALGRGLAVTGSCGTSTVAAPTPYLPSDRPSMPTLIEVRRVPIGDRLGLVSLGQDHEVIWTDVSRGVEVSAPVNNTRTTVQTIGVLTTIVAKPDVVNTKGRLRSLVSYGVTRAMVTQPRWTPNGAPSIDDSIAQPGTRVVLGAGGD
jgi:hypothetical protein